MVSSALAFTSIDPNPPIPSALRQAKEMRHAKKAHFAFAAVIPEAGGISVCPPQQRTGDQHLLVVLQLPRGCDRHRAWSESVRLVVGSTKIMTVSWSLVASISLIFAISNYGTIPSTLDRIQAYTRPLPRDSLLFTLAPPTRRFAIPFKTQLTMKFEMAATLALAAGASAFVAPSLPLRARVASSSASSTSMMAGERSKALPMLPKPPLVRRTR